MVALNRHVGEDTVSEQIWLSEMIWILSGVDSSCLIRDNDVSPNPDTHLYSKNRDMRQSDGQRSIPP